MKWKVLITAPYLYPVIKNYLELFESNDIEPIILKVNERLSEQELLGLDCIEQIHGIACGDDRITERVLKKAKSLKVISKWGTGTDSINKEAAATYGIPVCNTVNVFTDAVADTAMGFILAFARRIPQLDSDMKKGLWQKQNSVSLKECVLGIVGVGNIGKAVARRAKAFGMRVLGNDIKENGSSFFRRFIVSV
jgi:D-3-phosphoglycerate dehydrogenase